MSAETLQPNCLIVPFATIRMIDGAGAASVLHQIRSTKGTEPGWETVLPNGQQNTTETEEQVNEAFIQHVFGAFPRSQTASRQWSAPGGMS
jgi:hypothetical protein